MVWDAGTITDAAPWNQISQKMKNACGLTGSENWEFLTNVPAGTGLRESGNANYSLDVFRCNGKNTKYKSCEVYPIGSVASSTDTNSYNISVSGLSANKFFMVVVMSSKASNAEDPTSVTMNGSYDVTFTKIGSQALTDASATQKMSVWFGKSGSDAPTATVINIAFANNTTGILAFAYEISGISTSLAATGTDATGATQAMVSLTFYTGANSGTAAFTAFTQPALLNLENFWFSCMSGITTASGTYTFPNLLNINSYIGITTPTMHMVDGWSPDGEELTASFRTSVSMTYWVCFGVEFVTGTETTAFTNLNRSGDDWHLIIQRPVSDGAVSSVLTTVHRFNNVANIFSGPAITNRTSGVPTGTKYWKSSGWHKYTQLPDLNQLSSMNLLTTGISYWLKVTPDIFIINLLANTSRYNYWSLILDSLVTNPSLTDPMPLIAFQVSEAVGNYGSFCTLPGVTTANNNFTLRVEPWTMPVNMAHTQQLTGYSDLWIGTYKVFISRCLCLHNAGFYYNDTLNLGGVRGLFPDDILCMANPSSTAVPGDTLQINDETWVVVGSGYVGYNAGQRLNFMVKDN